MNVTIITLWRLHDTVNIQPLSHLEFRREIEICLMKTLLGFTLRRQLCGGPTADLPANIRFDGLDHTKVSTTQGDAISARKMPDTSAINAVFVCIATRMLCILICTMPTMT